MPVRFTKSVMISNPRLECLYLFFCFILALLLGGKFIYRQEFLAFYPAARYIEASIESRAVEQAELEGFYASQADKCAELAGDCMPPCPPVDGLQALREGLSGDNQSLECCYSQQLAVPVGVHHLFITSVHELNLHLGVAKSLYYPYEEATWLRLYLSVNLPVLSFETIVKDTVGPTAKTISTATMVGGIHTVLVNHDGSIYQAVDGHPEYVDITVAALVEMSGLGADYLDREQDVEGVAKTGRDTGAIFNVDVDCYDSQSAWMHLSEPIEEELRRSGADVLCVVGVQVSARKAEAMDGRILASTRTSIHGILVNTAVHGTFSRPSILSVLDAVVQMMVLAAVPKVCALVLASHCLGHLSRIYRRVIYEPFDIAEQVAGTAMRLTSNTVAFEELCEHSKSVISKHTLRQRIAHATKHRIAFTQAELERFVDFSYSAVANLGHFTKYDTLTRELQEDAKSVFNIKTYKHLLWTRVQPNRVFSDPNSREAHLGIDSFTRGCSSNDQIFIEDTIHLFCNDRKVSLLEHVFLPAYIRRFRKAHTPFGTQFSDAEASPESHGGTTPGSRTVSEMLGSHAEHGTQGAKAYAKVVDLERRHSELEVLSGCWRVARVPGHSQNDLREPEPQRQVEDVSAPLASTESLQRSIHELEQRYQALEKLVKVRSLFGDLPDSLQQAGSGEMTGPDVSRGRTELGVTTAEAAGEQMEVAADTIRHEVSEYLAQLSREVGYETAKAIQSLRCDVKKECESLFQAAQVIIENEMQSALEAYMSQVHGCAEASGTSLARPLPDAGRGAQASDCSSGRSSRCSSGGGRNEQPPRRTAWRQRGRFLGDSLEPSAEGRLDSSRPGADDGVFGA